MKLQQYAIGVFYKNFAEILNTGWANTEDSKSSERLEEILFAKPLPKNRENLQIVQYMYAPIDFVESEINWFNHHIFWENLVAYYRSLYTKCEDPKEQGIILGSIYRILLDVIDY